MFFAEVGIVLNVLLNFEPCILSKLFLDKKMYVTYPNFRFYLANSGEKKMTQFE